MNAYETLALEHVVELNKLQQRRDHLELIRPELEQLDDLVATMWREIFDFNELSHEDVMRVMQVFKAGKWTKAVDDGAITYSTTITRGVEKIQIRCWRGQPPPHCKIVEVEVEIPAQPAQRIMRSVLQCPSGDL